MVLVMMMIIIIITNQAAQQTDFRLRLRGAESFVNVHHDIYTINAEQCGFV
jgi:hypothetical protein